MTPLLAFIDLEIGKGGHIADIGCCRTDGHQYHGQSVRELYKFLEGVEFICGHNILQHDLKYLEIDKAVKVIDTLCLSPLLFPAKPYHRLVKDYKLDPENSNNPLTDAIKTRELLEDEIAAFRALDADMQNIYYQLLHDRREFSSFFEYFRFKPASGDLKGTISKTFAESICSNALLDDLIYDKPIELAYSLALISADDLVSVFPPWIIKSYNGVQQCFRVLRNNGCVQGCPWCSNKLNVKLALQRWFGYSDFRNFDGVPLQEDAVKAAIANKSLLTIFPTGGGKSITFQLPALMAGEAERGLTVVISPLQSLMKDQVDNLFKRGITEAVTINGLLDPIERANSIERVQDGGANLLYISPESLRSNTIERLLEGRHIARFVIDEAHCFSTWGQDFRVDYLYIGDFIKKLQQTKNLDYSIPVSCFTATAKQKVIADIRKYFKEKLDLTLELFTTRASRPNLQYRVVASEGQDKYQQLRSLLEADNCPTIVYVSRTKKAEKLAMSLCSDGFNAKFYHGKMDSRQRIDHQDAFMNGETDIMVATSAFGMGVDKSNVGMVIHYEISNSLENYIQEAGRAGRDESINANCYVLFDEEDLNKHFVLLNQTKLTKEEINQVWRAIKNLTKKRASVSNSALEIARRAGWDDEVADMETRIITAIAALEESGYLLRGNNSPRVYATGILANSAQDAIDKITASINFAEADKFNAIRIIKRLFSAKRVSEASSDEGETRIDYLADHLGLQKETVIHIINLLREEKILADSKDLKAFVKRNIRAEDNMVTLTARYINLEKFILTQLNDGPTLFHLKELNEKATEYLKEELNPSHLKTILNIWAIQGWISKKRDIKDNHYYHIQPRLDINEIGQKIELRRTFAGTIVRYLFNKVRQLPDQSTEEALIEFSVLEAKEYFTKTNQLFQSPVRAKDIEDTLFYLSRIEAIDIEGGFMVLYNRLTIERKEMNSLIAYKNEDYKKLEEHYLNKIQQIHIVGEYAQRMINNYNDALQFADDYFQLNYSSFLSKYFPGRKEDISLKITKGKFEQLFGELSLEQNMVMKDNASQYIVVAAGPGSGKTRVLVHKLGSLLQLEDVKHEQLLMLTFSRAATSEFKSRLHKLVGNAAYYVEIKTFHSYCFDLLGRVGSLEKAESIIKTTIAKIHNGDILLNRITKAVLVIDEAQDISADEFELIRLLVEKNEAMRVILVGDDDQNIFAWRGASADCMKWFLSEKKAKAYTLLDNYRSKEEIVAIANQFVSAIQNRLKKKQIVSKQGMGGTVNVIQYTSREMIVPLVKSIAEAGLSGSVAVLTTTNEEAAMITWMLIEKGFPAKLIQTDDGFRLNNLLELRVFSKMILGSHPDVHTIALENFINSIVSLKNLYSDSPNIDLVLKIIGRFQQEYSFRMYKTDWETFLAESKFEDFYSEDSEVIQVATIHKAKGKEFDNVFVLLNDKFFIGNDEKKRLLYVAITRARNNLHVHYNHDYLKNYNIPGFVYISDSNQFVRPDSLSLVLILDQVWLSFFDSNYRQRLIEGIKPGKQLEVSADSTGCNLNGTPIVKFSNDFKVFLDKYLNDGYKLQYASIGYIVYWKTEKGYEIKVILPEIRLRLH